MKVANTNGDKSWNHEVSVKVADINHKSLGHKPSRHVEMFATKFVTSLQQTRLCHRYNAQGKLATKSTDSRTLSWTQITKVMICVMDFHDLCLRCRKVGVMELKLNLVNLDFCLYIHIKQTFMYVSYTSWKKFLMPSSFLTSCKIRNRIPIRRSRKSFYIALNKQDI